MSIGVGHKSALIEVLVKSLLSMLLLNVPYMILRDSFLDCLMQVPVPNAFEVFLYKMWHF